MGELLIDRFDQFMVDRINNSRIFADFDFDGEVPVGHRNLAVRYSHMLCIQDVGRIRQNNQIGVAIKIDRKCELWSSLHPQMKLENFIMFVDNLNNYHMCDLPMFHLFILKILANQFIDKNWKQWITPIVQFIDQSKRHCLRVLIIAMSLIGRHEFWENVHRQTKNSHFKKLYRTLFK